MDDVRIDARLRVLAAAGLLALGACGGNRAAVKPVAAQPAAPPMKLLEMPAAVTWKEARESMAAGDFETARRKLQAYLAREPKSAGAWFDAGWVAEKQDDPATAAADYRKALDLDAGQTGAALDLIRLDRAQDKLADAENAAQTALAKAPDDPRLLDALASLQRQKGRLDEAAATVRKVLARHPRDADAYKNLAAIEADRGHLRLAESALNNARKLDDKDAGIVNSLGLLAMKRDETSQARAFFEEATRLDPSLAAPWANLGALALQVRDYPAADQAYAKAVLLEPHRWATHLARAWALEGMKKPKEARAEYEQVLAARPQQEDALFGRANALKGEGDLPAALAAFRAYAALPGAARLKDAQAQIASIDLRLKNPPQAAKPAAVAKERAAGGGEVDLSRLPVGTDTGPSSTQLPSDAPETPAPAPAPPPPSAPEKSPRSSVAKPTAAVNAHASVRRESDTAR